MIKKLKPRLNVKRAVEIEKEQETTKKTRKKKEELADRYSPEFDPLEVVLSDNYKLIFTVQRDNDNGLLELDIRMYQTMDVYTGFTRKGVRIPLEKVSEMENTIYRVLEKCEEVGLMEEALEYEESGAREYAESEN